MLHELTATEAAHRIRRGDLTSEALVDACFARIDAREAAVGAWQFIDRERAIRSARAADRTDARGPLHGVPVAFKDIIDTGDMPTELGSAIYAGRRPSWDASCVAAVRAAGAIVLGKTVTTEFAFFAPGKTRNPHRLDRTPGGSSSGSAAAVADCMVPVAFGTQTSASVIRPAAYCGVLGYKPSFGDLSLSGIRPLAESLDTLGVFARSVDDLALVRGALIGEWPTANSLAAPPRIGVCRTPNWSLAEPCSQHAVESIADLLRKAGARVSEIVLAHPFDGVTAAQKTIMDYEVAHNYVHETVCGGGRLSRQFRDLCEAGRRISRLQYLAAKKQVAGAAAMLPAVFNECDALISPATIGEAPLADATGDPVMSRMWTALRVPSLAIPVAKGPLGLPLAVQMIGAERDDDRLLQIAHWACGRLSPAQ